MANRFKIGVLKASLPRYFPEKYGVFAAAEAALATLCESEGVALHVVPVAPMDGRDTMRALDACRVEGVDFVLVVLGGFTMGDVARTVAASEFPAGFWSVPEPTRVGDVQLNNFVSLNMAMSIARLVRDLTRRPVQWYHGAPGTPAVTGRLRTTLKALAAAKALRDARIGCIGGLAATFYNMEVSTNELRQRLGVEIFHHETAELVARMREQDGSRVAAEVDAMAARAPVDGVSDDQMALTGRAALALRDMASEGAYAALTVSDWPLLQDDPGMYPGGAFTWLEEVDGIPAASEGDVLGAITQLVAKSLTGRVGYLLDMTEPDFDSGKLLMWHGGGGPLHLAKAGLARWINHPMIGRGTASGPTFGSIVDLEFAEGPVTVFRVGRNASSLFSMTAQVAAHASSGFDGCRGWLDRFAIAGEKASMGDVVNTVMMHGLEHHYVLVAGDYSNAVAEFGAWQGLQSLSLRRDRGQLDVSDFS